MTPTASGSTRNGDPSDPGLLAAISQAPVRVAAFFLYSPPDPPRWRLQETQAEREGHENGLSTMVAGSASK